ncbi:hypothetical protein [Kitasatospora sp. NPDC057015]|uniref:hypothetical protein n=1 Tax=Kitasatospora sp. NPDC057015 TaxID=3346001 RepID=UPI003626AEC2
MTQLPIRRMIGAGAASMVAALAAGTMATPAYASTVKLNINTAASVQISADPAAPPQFGENLSIRIGRSGTSAPITNATLTLDTGGLTGLATLASPGCTTAGTLVSCPVHYLNYEDINLSSTNLWLSAVSGVRPGSSGTVHVTLSAPDADSAEADVRVDVGGPAFKAKELQPLSAVAVGSTVTPAPEFANRGGAPASRAIVEITALPGLGITEWPSNCEHASAEWGGGAGTEGLRTQYAICTIDAAIAPGEAVRLEGLRYNVTSEAFYTFVDFSVFATPDAEAASGPRLRKELTFQRGTGAPLGLAKVADSVPAGYPDRNGFFTELEVSAENTADFAASGSWAPDATGRHGKLDVGLQNQGPASVFDRSGGEGAVVLKVALPQGASAQSVPAGCTAVTREHGEAVTGPTNTYTCEGLGSWMPNGGRKTYQFDLALDSSDLAPAEVSLQNTQSELEPGHDSAVMRWDANPANDLVKVRLGAAAGGGTPSPTATPSGTASPSGTAAPTGTATTGGTTQVSLVTSPAAGAPAGTAAPSTAPVATGADGRPVGGSLASTGGSGTLPLAGASAAALLTGAAAVVVARRRRTGSHG